MKKKLALLAILALALAIGSHYLPSQPVTPPVVPEIGELDNYLVEQESRYTDITEGAEKVIVWANDKKEQTEYSVIYLHGYSATRQESAPLSDLLATSLGANAFHTRLTGHGRADDQMVESKLKLWKKDTLEAYEIGSKIGKKIIVVSVSTGGTLSTWLSAQAGTEAIVAQLMISPNFDIPNQDAYLIDLPLGIGVKVAEWTAGKEHSWTAKNELQEKYWSTRHPIRSARPMVQLLKEVKKIDKNTITSPVLMIYSTKDTVILPAAIEENFKYFGSAEKKLVQFNESEDTHVLASEIVSPDSVAPMLDILLNFLYENKIAPQPQAAMPEMNDENAELVEPISSDT